MKNTIIAIVVIIVLAAIWYAVSGTNSEEAMENVENTNTEMMAEDTTPAVSDATADEITTDTSVENQ